MKLKRCSNINFGMKRQYSVKLNCPNIFDKEVEKDFFVSELEFSDKSFIDKNRKKWKNTLLGEKIINNFVKECKEENSQVGKNKRFFIIEQPRKFGKSQIKAMCLAELISNNIYISYLQAEREYGNKKHISGLGSSIIYAIVNLAKKLEKNSVTLTFANKSAPFYQNLGFIRFSPFTHNFFLHKNDFYKVTESIKNKYPLVELK